MIPDEYDLNVNHEESDAFSCIWNGGKSLANGKDFNDLVVSKKLYEEYGHSICKKKFDLFQC
jgi:actin-related protein